MPRESFYENSKWNIEISSFWCVTDSDREGVIKKIVSGG